MRRIVEMSDGTFRVQHRVLWWWSYDMMGDGNNEWVLGFKTVDEARSYISPSMVGMKRVVEYHPPLDE